MKQDVLKIVKLTEDTNVQGSSVVLLIVILYAVTELELETNNAIIKIRQVALGIVNKMMGILVMVVLEKCLDVTPPAEMLSGQVTNNVIMVIRQGALKTV